MKRFIKGYSLIEILVVVGIILLVAAIIFPVFMSGKMAAKTTSFTNSLKQMGAAMELYAGDHSDHVPWGVTRYGKGTGNPNAQIRDLPLESIPTVEDQLLVYIKNDSIFCPVEGDRLNQCDRFRSQFYGTDSVFFYAPSLSTLAGQFPNCNLFWEIPKLLNPDSDIISFLRPDGSVGRLQKEKVFEFGDECLTHYYYLE